MLAGLVRALRSGVKYQRTRKTQLGALELIQSARARSSAKRFFLIPLALFSLAPLAMAAQGGATKSSSWSGILVSSACNPDEAFAESPECMKDVPGAKLVLYDDTNRVMYGLEPQTSVTAHLGETVTAHGTLDDNTIRLSSIELMSIGLAVGQPVPAFPASSQFGDAETPDAPNGANATLLFTSRKRGSGLADGQA